MTIRAVCAERRGSGGLGNAHGHCAARRGGACGGGGTGARRPRTPLWRKGRYCTRRSQRRPVCAGRPPFAAETGRHIPLQPIRVSGALDSNCLESSILVLKCVQPFCCNAAEHRLPITFKTSLSPFKLDTPNENMPSTLSKFKVFKFWLEPLCARSCSCIIFIQMLKCLGTWFWLQPTNLACCLTLTVSFTLSHIRLPRQKTEQCRISS